MIRFRALALLSLLFLSLAVVAENVPPPPYTMSPSSGPTSGGTTVTIQGNFAEWPYQVHFGAVPAASTTRVDARTLVAVTPPHLPGTSRIRIFEYDLFLDTALRFEFEGPVPESAFERILLPVFAQPVNGAFGSLFVSSLSAGSIGAPVELYGPEEPCNLTCLPVDNHHDFPLLAGLNDIEPNGNPGRFFYVPVSQIDQLAMNLRVFDWNRREQNFGTEMPIVRARNFTKEPILLLSVPTDPRFRNTLRVYAANPATVLVRVGDRPEVPVTLRAGENLFDPAYAVFTDFPIGTLPVNVMISQPTPPISGPVFHEPIWAFVSVTNNDTQLITTITPEPR